MLRLVQQVQQELKEPKVVKGHHHKDRQVRLVQQVLRVMLRLEHKDRQELEETKDLHQSVLKDRQVRQELKDHLQ